MFLIFAFWARIFSSYVYELLNTFEYFLVRPFVCEWRKLWQKGNQRKFFFRFEKYFMEFWHWKSFALRRFCSGKKFWFFFPTLSNGVCRWLNTVPFNRVQSRGNCWISACSRLLKRLIHPWMLSVKNEQRQNQALFTFCHFLLLVFTSFTEFLLCRQPFQVSVNNKEAQKSSPFRSAFEFPHFFLFDISRRFPAFSLTLQAASAYAEKTTNLSAR